MCLIVHKKANETLSQNFIDDVYRRNNDGWGMGIYHDSGLVVYKGVAESVAQEKKDLKKCWSIINSNQGKEMIIHFRMRTHGVINLENTHPFEVVPGVWLMHNGVVDAPEIPEDILLAHLKSKENALITQAAELPLLVAGEPATTNAVTTTPTSGTGTLAKHEVPFSDTWRFANLLIKPMLENYNGDLSAYIRSPGFRFMLEKLAGSNNRFALFDKKGVVRYNLNLWSETTGGLCVSNNYAFTYGCKHNVGYNVNNYHRNSNNHGTTTPPARTTTPSTGGGTLPPVRRHFNGTEWVEREEIGHTPFANRADENFKALTRSGDLLPKSNPSPSTNTAPTNSSTAAGGAPVNRVFRMARLENSTDDLITYLKKDPDKGFCGFNLRTKKWMEGITDNFLWDTGSGVVVLQPSKDELEVAYNEINAYKEAQGKAPINLVTPTQEEMSQFAKQETVDHVPNDEKEDEKDQQSFDVDFLLDMLNETKDLSDFMIILNEFKRKDHLLVAELLFDEEPVLAARLFCEAIYEAYQAMYDQGYSPFDVESTNSENSLLETLDAEGEDFVTSEDLNDDEDTEETEEVEEPGNEPPANTNDKGSEDNISLVTAPTSEKKTPLANVTKR